MSQLIYSSFCSFGRRGAPPPVHGCGCGDATPLSLCLLVFVALWAPGLSGLRSPQLQLNAPLPAPALFALGRGEGERCSGAAE